MPRGDGTGPPWGDGQGAGSGTGKGFKGAGRMGGSRPGAGPKGNCVCPNCGAKLPHHRSTPCYTISCPQCGAKMVRE